jgi:hypothetical protein
MKKISVLFIVLVLFTVLYAEPINMFRFGFLAPRDSNIGTIAGYCYGASFDNTVTLFTSGDLFYRNYSKQKSIGYTSAIGSTQVVPMIKTSDISTYYIPLQFNGHVNAYTIDKYKFYCGGGFGFGLLWEDVFVAADDTHLAVNETKFFSGFNWNLRAGARYPLSNHTAITGEVFYNNGRMKRDVMVTPVGITWNEIDMGGFGMRIGLEVPAF